MATSMSLGNQLPVSRSLTNNLASGYLNYQDHNHATKSSSVSTIYAASASHFDSLSHPAVPVMNIEGKLITPVFDEEMGSEIEDSPIVHADGLKRPRISTNAKTISPTGDIGAMAHIILQCWSNIHDSLPSKLKALSVTLTQWNRDRKSNQSKKVRDWEAKLKNLEEQDPDENTLASILDIKLALNVEADKEEIYWEQRSRINWLCHGDKNTAYFHRCASARKKQNIVKNLKNNYGVLVSDELEMVDIAESYFKELFSTSVSDEHNSFWDSFQPTLSTVSYNILDTTFTSEEILAALKEMSPLKASGNDGFPALFYQKYWHIVGQDVTNYCLSFLNGWSELNAINNTNIILIPKVQRPTNMTQFRPISLCNILYKVIAKTLANRLRETLNDCIDESQGAFLPGRQITDNILIGGLLEMGLGWRVGNGQSISIRDDAWLPGPGHGRVGNSVYDPNFSLVSDLVDPLLNTWKEDIVLSIFPPAIAQCILCIQLPISAKPDFIVWRGDNTGEYSVKSGYKMLVNSNQHVFQASQHVASTTKSFYDSLWNSAIPSKTKITVWRFARNFLPTRSNLSSRHLVNDYSCPFCWKTVQHLGFECNVTKQILAALHINIPVRDPNLEWLSWLDYCISSLSKSSAALLFITFWAIWGFRNRLVHENVLPALDSYVMFIRTYAAEYTTSQMVLNRPSLPSPSHWIPPPGNLIKVNFDATFDNNSFSSSSGIVFRNNEGLLMAAAVFPHSYVPNSCAAEAQACLDAVSLAHELSFHNIIIEGDSLTVIKKLNSASIDRSLISMSISDVKHLSEGFESVTFKFVNRDCNAAAHQAALLGRNCSSFLIWIEEAPTTIEEIVRKDRRWVDPPD
ncbi:hypothetical protein GQ457_10G021430 [Hibiscus cannabinus]